MGGKIGFLSLFYHSGLTGHDPFFILCFSNLERTVLMRSCFYHSTFQCWKRSHAEIGVPGGSC